MKNQTYQIVYTGIFAVLLTICAWISLPTFIPFTLQTFGVFLTLLLLGGKQGTVSILVYLLLGFIGIPVFSNFGAGAGYLLGNTGGFVLGFLLIGSTYWLLEKFSVKNQWIRIFSLLLGLMLCYAFGTLWFVNISTGSLQNCGTMTALTMCVFPFIIPDFGKLALAWIISKRIKPYLKLKQ